MARFSVNCPYLGCNSLLLYIKSKRYESFKTTSVVPAYIKQAIIYWLISNITPNFYSFQNITIISFDLLTYITSLLIFVITVYILCYFVSSSTLNVMTIADMLFDLFWYQLPHDEQCIVQLIISRAQKPYEIKGLGVLACSLDVYSMVRHFEN